MSKTRKEGDIAIPKDIPELKGKIVKVDKFLGETLYVLSNGCMYTDRELKPKA